jgi:putative ABC transport system permease protein
MFFKLAFSNLWRNKRRTFFTEITIVFGVLVIIFVGSFLKGMSRGWAVGMVESYTGAMQIEHKDYAKEHKFKPMETTLTDAQSLIQEIEAFPKVTAAFGSLAISGMISNGTKSTTFFGQGVDTIAKHKTLPEASRNIGKGRDIAQGKNEVVLGPKLAEDLDVKIGDSVMLLAQTRKGGLNMTELLIVGLLNSGDGLPDIVSAHYVNTNLEVAQKLLRMSDRVSQIIIGYDDFDSIKNAIGPLQVKVNQISQTPLVLQHYEDLIPGYEINNFFSIMGIVIGTILFIIVGAGIANAMFMSVMERRKEIGTMKAIGSEQGHIRRLFMYEGVITGILGAIVGVIFSIIVVKIVENAGGIPLPPPPGSSEPIRIAPYLNIGSCIYSFVLTLIISIIASYLPAAVSAKLDPVMMLREE